MLINKDKILVICDKAIESFFYVLLFCLPFSTALIEIAASFIIVAWIIKKVVRWQPVTTYLNLPIFAYILAVFLSVIFSSNFVLSLKNFGSKTMEYVILFFIAAEFMSDRRILKNVIIVMLVSAAMIGADCIFQYIFRFDFLRLKPLEATRVTASFKMPGDLAGYLGPMFCLSLSLSFLKLKKGMKFFLRIESIIFLVLLFISLARGAWFGLVAAVFFLGMWGNRKVFYLAIVFLVILAVGVFCLMGTPGEILERIASIFSDTSNLDRKTIWQASLRMIKDRPLFGHGLSSFMGVFPRYGQDYQYLKEGIIPYAHNCYLQIAAETGLIGFLSFLWLIGAFFFRSIRSLKKMAKSFNHAVLAGICAGIIATLVHSAVDTNLYSLQLSVLFWFMLGMNAALQREFAFEKVEK